MREHGILMEERLLQTWRTFGSWIFLCFCSCLLALLLAEAACAKLKPALIRRKPGSGPVPAAAMPEAEARVPLRIHDKTDGTLAQRRNACAAAMAAAQIPWLKHTREPTSKYHSFEWRGEASRDEAQAEILSSRFSLAGLPPYACSARAGRLWQVRALSC